jgi:monovalent cation:H+ antiporter-2, CPA2 family
LRENDEPSCIRLADIDRHIRPGARGWEECLVTGEQWVHLGLSMTCGLVGCCDDSKNRHATKHRIMRSLEPSEHWGWCYVDELPFQRL